MSKSGIKKNAVINTKQSNNNVMNTKQIKRKTRGGRKYRKQPQIKNFENVRMAKTESWFDVNLTSSDAATTVARKDFDITNGPAWFKKMAALYEKYQLHHVELEFVSGMPSTASGNYVLSYNTNYGQKSDSRTMASCAAQKNAKISHVSKNCKVIIPGGALPKFRTNASCSDAVDSWQFNVEIMRTGTVALSGLVKIRYFLTFRNPSI